MSVIASFAVPHPPLAVHGVGRGREAEISATLDAYRQVARQIADLAPDVLIISSPHATCYSDYIHISPGTHADGDFGSFGDPADEFEVDYDARLVRAIEAECAAAGIPAGTEGQRNPDLDHGVMVPLYFIQAAGVACPIVRVGISGLGPDDHYRFGQCVQAATEKLGRKAVWVASGDLSHKLLADGPYGFAPDGPVFDELACDAFESGDFLKLLTADPGMCERAAECGLRSFQMMAGALDRRSVEARLLSHEGTFGVGYGVATFIPGGPDPARDFLEQYVAWHARAIEEARAAEDPWVRLAHTTVELWVRQGRKPTDAEINDAVASAGCDDMDAAKRALFHTRAGAFCSIKKNGSLRGCIGTISPVRDCLADEIVANAVSAAESDPRFSPITPDELCDLVISVDVLGEAEPIADESELDPSRYGVIVSARDGRRGLLLPDLDGVDTVEEQVSIARRKGGIGPRERVSLQRFEVVRHH